MTRDFQEKRARDSETSGRSTREDRPSMATPTLPDPEIFEAADDGRLVELAMYRALLRPALEKNQQRLDDTDPPIDALARERAEEEIAQLHGRISEAEAVLNWLAGFIGDRGLGSAAVNSAGIKLGEVREQLPVIRQAVRDMERES